MSYFLLNFFNKKNNSINYIVCYNYQFHIKNYLKIYNLITIQEVIDIIFENNFVYK